MAKTKPVATFRIGYVKAAVWKNDDFYNVTLVRSYKDDEGNWRDTDSFGHGDLLNAAKCLERCEEYIEAQGNPAE